MPNYQFKCKDCKSEFDKHIYLGKISSTFHTGGGETHIIEDKIYDKDEYRTYMDNKLKATCPVCMSENTFKMVFAPAIVYDDNIAPGSGWSVVDKRHQLGLDWDSPSGLAEARAANMEMKMEGMKQARKDFEDDNKQLSKTMRQVSEKEAMEVLKSGDRKQEVSILKTPE